MLKPFQLRNLHVYPAEENLYDSSTESIISSSHVDDTQRKISGLIHLSAPEYDEILQRNSKASLTYIDDDDGDVITVGSSLELEQRLDEPAQSTGFVLPDQAEPVPIHLFDIRRSRSVIELWKEVEQDSALRQRHTPDLVIKSNVTEAKPSENEPSSETPQLVSNNVVDLHKQWFDACRPPQLSSNENPGGTPHSTVAHNVEPSASSASETRSSSTIMSLSAITDEGRHQAEEAGSRLRGLLNASTGSQAAPDFIRNQENPWATPAEVLAISKDSNLILTEPFSEPIQIPSSETQPPQSSVESEPLLSAFEAEMAKILEENAQVRVDETTDSGHPTESHTHQPDLGEQSWPFNLVTGLLQTVAGGIENLGAELKTKIPEVERHLANAQKAIPEDVGIKMQTALTAVESQIQNLAQVIQNASNASGEAAERVRRADLRRAEEVISGIGDMAHEFEDFGKTLFAAFEAEFGQQNNTEPNTRVSNASDEGASSAPSQRRERDGQISTESLDQTLKPTTSSAGNDTSRGPQADVQEATSTAASTAAYQQPPPLYPTPSLVSQAAGQAVKNDQPQTTDLHQEKPLFSNWPNRSAFVPSPKSTVDQPRTVDINQDHESKKPLFSNWSDRPVFTQPSEPTRDQSQADDVRQADSTGNWWGTSPLHRSREETSSTPQLHHPFVFSNLMNDVQIQSTRPTTTSTNPAAPSERTDERHPEEENSGQSLFMGNIGFEVTERTIEEVFASQHFSVRVHLPIDSSTGKHAGFGYAHFESASAAKAALTRLQGVVIDGHSLNLEQCDNTPIDGLQTQTLTSEPARASSGNSRNRTLNHRHSWHPNSLEWQERRPPAASSSDNLPPVFSGNARSNVSRAIRPVPSQRSTLVEGDTSHNHPEESPEFAARYPSLLPSYRSQDRPVSVPRRSMTLSPNSEIARFPPVSQLDAHLLVNQHRSEEHTENAQSQSGSYRAPSARQVVADRPAQRTTETHTLREPRRMASTMNRRSGNESQRDPNGMHALRRRATEAASLRHRAHQNSFRETRPTSLYDRPTRTLPGSFPVDDVPAPAIDNSDIISDQAMRTALHRSTIDDCVDTLMRFGYGTQVDGGRGRLSVYAEAASGNVSEAIDMIEEERTAYERYVPVV